MKCLNVCIGMLSMVIIAAGCASSGHSGRGKLSEVIEKTSDDYSGSRSIEEPEPDIDSGNTHDKERFVYHETGPTHSTWDHEPARSLATFSGGTGTFYENDFEDLYQTRVSYGFFGNEGEHRLEGFVGVGTARVKPESKLYESINHGVTIFNIGVCYKRFVTSSHTFMGLYYLGGAAYKRMFWRYKNTITIYGTREEDRINSDDLEGLELFAGVGVNLIQTDYVQLGIEVAPNLTLWEFETYEGFENDIFNASGGVSYNAVLTVLFD